MPTDSIDPALLVKLVPIKAIICDVDGTLTDGRIFMSESGEPMRAFSTRDGLGVLLLQDANIKVAWLTATSRGKSTTARAHMLNIPPELIDVGVGEKGTRFTALCKTLALPEENVAFIGDDLNDLPAMARSALSACPEDAHASVRAAVDLVLTHPGGQGAFRELADLLITAHSRANPAKPAL